MASHDEEWLSITEAAARLTAAGDRIDRSSLSRYLKQHGEALILKPDGKSNLVEINALFQHRGENIRIRTTQQPARSAASHSDLPKRTQSDGVARKAQADAELREMDLAVRRKELTPVSEVDQGGRDAIALMLSAFERAIESEASALSLKYGWDERPLRIALKSFSRVGLATFNREILLRLDAMRRQTESGEPIGENHESGQALQ